MKLVYNIKDKPKFSQLIVFAFQQLLAIMAATVAVPMIIGNGSNMLISDKGLNTVVINMCRSSAEVRYLGDGIIECDAGVTLSKVCNFALDKELTGLEFAYGIPGSVGGAVYMNAGAMGGTLSDTVEWVEAYLPAERRVKLTVSGVMVPFLSTSTI